LEADLFSAFVLLLLHALVLLSCIQKVVTQEFSENCRTSSKRATVSLMLG